MQEKSQIYNVNILKSKLSAPRYDTRYKKLYFTSVIVQQITLATRAVFRHDRCKN